MAARVARPIALSIGGLVSLEVIVTWILVAVVGWGWSEALDTFVLSNSVIAISFGLCGAIVAYHEASNPVGWLFATQGICHGTTAVLAPMIHLVRDDASTALLRALSTVAQWAWPWSIGLCLPLALLLFPDGRLPSRRWRPALWAMVVTAPLFALEMASGPEPLDEGLPSGYLVLPRYDDLEVLWTATELRNLVCLILACAALVVRYRTGGRTERAQLRWLFLATVTVLGFITPWSLVAGTPVLVLLAIPLIPISVAVAVVRNQLWDINLVMSRVLVWALLTLVVLAAYGFLIALLDLFVAAWAGRSAFATVVVVLLAAPLLPRLRQLVERAMYGDRKDPGRLVRRLGERLPDGVTGLAASLADGLRLPYVGVVVDGEELCEHGSAGGLVERVPLMVGPARVGDLVVGLRAGERSLTRADRAAIALVLAPLALAVQSLATSADLIASRERLVTAREEERRRIRRDLHDGLGPALTGLAITADAAANLHGAESGGAGTAELLTRLRADSRQALTSVRHIVEDLRPPDLDQFGLLGALQQRIDRLATPQQSIRIDLIAPEQMPALSAAVEVAAYRVALEGVNNVLRHADASRATVRVACSGCLEVEVTDDGAQGAAWHPGVGLSSMRERTEELGGRLVAGPTTCGGRVWARFPMPGEVLA